VNATTAIPRVSLGWLLLAQALVLIPLWFHLPLWMCGLWLFCTVWRVQILRMRAAYPGRLLKVLLMVATAVGVYASQGSLIGLDATAALLVSAFLLKLLEMRSQRDARVLIYLGFFCIAVAYLFDAGLPWALYSLLPISTLAAALIGLQQTRLIARPQATFKLAATLLAQALPLMIVLFLFFPRLQPLWSLPLSSGQQAISGIEDSMTPADVTELARSTAVAFRASFDDGQMPPKRALYWRALSLDRYDGRTWTQSLAVQGQPVPAWQPQGPALRYRVLQAASGKPWLFALDTARSDQADVRQLSDFRLQRQRPVDQPLMYTLTSWPQALREPQLSEWARRAALQLGPSDPRSRAWGEQLKARFSEPQAVVAEVLQQFRTQPFHYTLTPVALGADSIDGFLFDSRRGFCAHYAGALTYVLRAAGIPARMVVGYQGGEVNQAGDTVTVRQFEAHAWVEFWQPARGWQSVDPTAAVAPERVEQGLEQALSADEPFLADSPFSPLRYRHLAWLNGLRLSWDEANYAWQRWVLGYQGQEQSNFLAHWFKGFESAMLPLSIVLVMALASLGVLRPWRHRPDPDLRALALFEKLLQRHGLQRGPAEPSLAFAERAARRLPAQAATIKAFAQAFNARHYAGDAQAGALMSVHLKQLRRQLRAVPKPTVQE